MTLAFLGQRRQAAMTAQEALQQSSPHPFLAYQASLIYALTGDENASLANVEKALQLNLGPRWFGLPWYDSLRNNPEFRQLLQAYGGEEFLSPRPQVEPLGLGEPEG